MNREDYITHVFCMIRDWLKKQNYRLRTRGPQPSLGDDEVLTMEIVGEFLGLDTDKSTHAYFKAHWVHLFPNIGHRTACVRQSANLLPIKRQLHRELAEGLGAFDHPVHIVDGFPITVCGFTRAGYSVNFRGEAKYGHCAAKRSKYYGFKGHLLIDARGVIAGLSVTAANVDEREAMRDFVGMFRGVLLRDKGYISKKRVKYLAEYGIILKTPLRSNMKESRSAQEIRAMNKQRRKIETIIGQLTQRFHIQQVHARDLWHFMSRIWRKILSHTMCVFLNNAYSRPLTVFNGLLDEN